MILWPEMILWPYLITKGWLPYQDIAIAHTPVLLGILTLWYKLLGSGIVQLKVFTSLLIVITDVFLYWLIYRKYGARSGLVGLLIYIFLHVLYFGNSIWFETLLTIIALAIFYFLKTKRFYFLGAFLALSYLTKQTGLAFLIPVGSALLVNKEKFVSLIKIAITFFSIILLFFLVLVSLGLWDDFYNWAILYATLILPRAPGQVQYPSAKEFILALMPYLIIAPYFVRKKDFILPLFAIAGTLGVYPRWEEFHFQPALPFLAMMFAETISFNRKDLLTKVIVILIIFIIGFRSLRYINRSWKVEDRFADTETLVVAEYIDMNTARNDSVYIINYWDNIYALSDTLPAIKPWIPQLGWYLSDEITDKMNSDLSNNPPGYVVWEKNTPSIPPQFGNEINKNYIKDREFENIIIYRKK